MPYVPHAVADTPANEVTIWRYMELPQFLLLLEERYLHFAIQSELEDRWEFAISKSMVKSIATISLPGVSGSLLSSMNAFNRMMTVSCWHRNPGESLAMWGLYTHERPGVAIKSSVGRLKRALSRADQEVMIGSVRYERHDLLPNGGSLSFEEPNPIRAVLQKRPCFEYEQEVRALHLGYPRPDTSVLPSTVVHIPFLDKGIKIPIDVDALISAVVISPFFPVWATSVITTALRRANLALAPVTSEIFSAPPTT